VIGYSDDKSQEFQLTDLEDEPSFWSNSSRQVTVVNPCLNSTYQFVEQVVQHLVNVHKVTYLLAYLSVGAV